MLKGIPETIVHSIEVRPLNAIDSVNVKALSYQDTATHVKNQFKSSIPLHGLKKTDSTSIGIEKGTAKAFSQKYVDSVFTKTNHRDKVISQELIPKTTIKINTSDSVATKFFDKQLPFQLKRTELDQSYSNNFLLTIPHKNISHQFDSQSSVKETGTTLVQTQGLAKNIIITHKESGFQGKLHNDASLDWLPAIILLSLFIFSWIKLIYQKYVIQVVASLINYQVSIRLFREKNVLFRNMALGLNFIFSVNTGLFLFYFLSYKHLGQILPNNFMSVLLYCLIFILFFNIKTFICKLIGNIFKVREEFSEYVHNIHLTNKNIGLFLFPIIILFPYITNDQVKLVVLYTGFAIIICLLFLFIYRVFQIIIRNGVSTFYLILYLCAVEILPIILLVKYSYTLI